MLRKEILSEQFFPVPQLTHEGSVVPAPPEAIAYRDALRNDWLREHPRLPKEEPRVSMAPGERDGQRGYSVRTEIVYLDYQRIRHSF